MFELRDTYYDTYSRSARRGLGRRRGFGSGGLGDLRRFPDPLRHSPRGRSLLAFCRDLLHGEPDPMDPLGVALDALLRDPRCGPVGLPAFRTVRSDLSFRDSTTS